MGKKTNWTTTENELLCRAWLGASDLQLHGEEQKAANFWSVVHELFHQEVETAVERPLNGVKVRWTRINRESQKFAAIFNELQSKGMKHAEESGGDSGDAAAVALLTEQQWIDEAKDIYLRIYNSKFTFEGCWKLLRYSTKWMQLFANGNSNPVLAMNALAAANATAAAAAAPPSTTSSEHDVVTPDNSSSPPSAAMSAPPPPLSSETTPSTVAAAAAVASAAQDGTFIVHPSHKRRADASLESFAHLPSHQQMHLQGLTSTLVEELRRQNDLMEDQNAIALLKLDGEMVTDGEARHVFQLLRTRYLKKVRTSHGYSNNGRTSTLV
ncbi:hypothetical protein PF005_g6188 [Phytophthora fragariae]|uniref:No apical meristem-associated C-terminal domain-containing protein n=1 Tax=Phytophthora fragariae TaxID=53985 RepID=A0A6A4EB45_9STRA|nr:hypothetical protein PF003_g1409 [Phytophthora fragariae]KAE8946779.1 hypothetical protein PF009_g3602 [Phytophthora fragariae]KAE8995552.1 hypothetical protein PF011_g16278 [Phytophthora fragariae]KAE9117395.1 hypothetical protein PF010_g8620 [Phytophthora fragariae]KAE9124820.1 hypothetical protein PF007_g6585 [Phytophthora fragariae]